MILSFRLLQISLSIVLMAILLLIWPEKALAEWTEWLADTEISYTFQDNINHAIFDSDEHSDQIWNALVSVGRVYQWTNNTRFFVNAQLDGSVHHKFEKLNQLRPGVSLAARHKFGLGPYQPWISGSVSASQIFSRSRVREGQQYTAGIDLGKRLHERLDLTLSYLFDYRNSSNSRTINTSRLMVAGLNPGKSSDVYDIKGHSVGIQFNTPLTQQWLLLLAYNFRYGDVVSSNNPTRAPRISGIVDAVAIDDALPGWAYRAEGKTHRYSVDANYAFGKGHAAVNLGYEFVESHVDSFIYRNNLFRVNVNYNF